MAMELDFNNILNLDGRSSKNIGSTMRVISSYSPSEIHQIFKSLDMYRKSDMENRSRARAGAIPILSVNVDGTITIDTNRWRSRMRYSTWQMLQRMITMRGYELCKTDTQTIYKRKTNLDTNNNGGNFLDWIAGKYEMEEANAGR